MQPGYVLAKPCVYVGMTGLDPDVRFDKPFRVVFDANVFTPRKFDLLEQSPMLRLCKSGRITPVYGHSPVAAVSNEPHRSR